MKYYLEYVKQAKPNMFNLIIKYVFTFSLIKIDKKIKIVLAGNPLEKEL